MPTVGTLTVFMPQPVLTLGVGLSRGVRSKERRDNQCQEGLTLRDSRAKVPQGVLGSTWDTLGAYALVEWYAAHRCYLLCSSISRPGTFTHIPRTNGLSRHLLCCVHLATGLFATTREGIFILFSALFPPSYGLVYSFHKSEPRLRAKHASGKGTTKELKSANCNYSIAKLGSAVACLNQGPDPCVSTNTEGSIRHSLR